MMTVIVPHDSFEQSRYTAPMTAKKPQLNPVLKIVLDLGPLVLFFIANSRPALFLPLVAPVLPADIAAGEHTGIFVATAVFMLLTSVDFLERRKKRPYKPSSRAHYQPARSSRPTTRKRFRYLPTFKPLPSPVGWERSL